MKVHQFCLKLTYEKGLTWHGTTGAIKAVSAVQCLNLPVFMFVYIYFNVPPTRITDLVRTVSDEKIY